MMRLVSSFDENTLDLLDHSWLDSVPLSKQCAHKYTHSKSGSCNEIPFISGGICPWVQGLSGHYETLSNIWQHTRQSFFDCVYAESCREEKTVGWIGGHAGTSNRKKTNHQPSCCSQPPPMYTSLSCTNTMPLGTVMFSRSYYSDYSSGHKRHTQTHTVSLSFIVPSDMKSKHTSTRAEALWSADCALVYN